MFAYVRFMIAYAFSKHRFNLYAITYISREKKKKN